MLNRSIQRARLLAVWLLSLVLLTQGLGGKSRDKAFVDELRKRSETDGLALVNAGARRMEIMQFGHVAELMPNPRGDSRAWLSGTGQFVAWNILNRPAALDQSPSPLVINALDGSQLWQLPGCVLGLSSMGVSPDGRRVAFQATYIPPGTVAPPENRADSVTSFYFRIRGLYFGEFGTKNVREVIRFPSPESGKPQGPQVRHWIRSISWSPEGNAFSYDDEGHIYVYEIAAKTQRSIASGSEPAWSPDGQWIAFRSTDGRAVAIRPATLETKVLLKGRKVEGGVTWSPDSRYMLASKKLSLGWDLFHGFLPDPALPVANVVYRLDDGAKFAFLSSTDQWVRDYRVFLQGASVPPKVDSCQGASGLAGVSESPDPVAAIRLTTGGWPVRSSNLALRMLNLPRPVLQAHRH